MQTRTPSLLPTTARRTAALAACAVLLAACSAPAPSPGSAGSPTAPSPAPAADTMQPAQPAPPAAAPAAPAMAGTPGGASPETTWALTGVPGELRVLGTEPFWGIQVQGDALHFTTAEDPAGKLMVAPPKQRADGIEYAGDDAGTAFALTLVKRDCSDGMSDRTYAYQASFRYGQTRYTGCADVPRQDKP